MLRRDGRDLLMFMLNKKSGRIMEGEERERNFEDIGSYSGRKKSFILR